MPAIRLSPIPIGCPSQTFLEWYGTEFICAQGYGLLHVPEILTSCYSSPRWLYLDRSWSSLFSAGARLHFLTRGCASPSVYSQHHGME